MLRGRSSGSSLPMAAAVSWDSILPSAGNGSERRGTKRTQELQVEVSESIAPRFVTKRGRIRISKPKDEQRTNEAHEHCR